eukprot:2788023-Pyramimonas_sp.AAC.1
MPSVQCVISDLLEFVQEGKLWGQAETEGLTDASRACSAVWRQLVALKRTQPAFAWVPSHRTGDEVLFPAPEDPLPPPYLWVVGNSWADFFAKLGALSVKLPEAHA